MKVLEAYCQEESFLKSAEKISLRDIASNMDMPAAERLMHYGTELKKIIYRIKKLQETNNRLIKDNIDFFDILLSGLKNTAAMQTGYSQKGETQEVKSNPVLFNQTV
jgi:flagellar biosynthesis/type III secretory pathway chaperone